LGLGVSGAVELSALFRSSKEILPRSKDPLPLRASGAGEVVGCNTASSGDGVCGEGDGLSGGVLRWGGGVNWGYRLSKGSEVLAGFGANLFLSKSPESDNRRSLLFAGDSVGVSVGVLI
jgi:hypothetical protein